MFQLLSTVYSVAELAFSWLCIVTARAGCRQQLVPESATQAQWSGDMRRHARGGGSVHCARKVGAAWQKWAPAPGMCG